LFIPPFLYIKPREFFSVNPPQAKGEHSPPKSLASEAHIADSVVVVAVLVAVVLVVGDVAAVVVVVVPVVVVVVVVSAVSVGQFRSTEPRPV
jgi:uncharacterized membrane protein